MHLYQVVLAIAVVMTILVDLGMTDSDTDWELFKHKYGKIYSPKEEPGRKYNWQRNLRQIARHNERFAAGNVTFYMSENKYSDMSREEFVRVMLGYKVYTSPPKVTPTVNPDLPKAVDWRIKGYVTPVKDQGPCGSCWAFSTTGGLEGAHFRATGKLVNLSESNLIDCSKRWGNYGCHGGMMDNAYQYIIDNGGIDTEKSYPYDPSDGHCFFTEKGIGATMKAYKTVSHGNETALQETVASVGPVSVAINADLDAFRSYGGGVFNHPNCLVGKLDHAVLVVGYGTDNKSGLDYWIVKNSWSDTWGMKGYIWMARNKNNQCGISSMPFYPVV